MNEITIEDYWTKVIACVGCDPGLIDPCMSVLFSNPKDPVPTIFIDGKQYTDYDNYSRAYLIGKEMAFKAKSIVGVGNIVLAIEGAPFGMDNSSSMESMARCRQAIFDAFRERFNYLQCTYDIAPASAKKALSGNGHATKQQMIQAAKILYPETMEGHEIYRLLKSGVRKGQKTLDEESMAMADSLAIAKAGMMKWEGESHVKK